jgi:spermidine synthase
MFRKFLSYFIPINVLNQKSSINKSIEVTWNNGQLVLDTKNTNYSYGSLQRILKMGLQEIGFSKIREFENILILGVAGGSVIKTLVNEINYKGKITGVEIDSEIIAVANKYFSLDKIKNTEIIIEDASVFAKKSDQKFDLIVIDIFQDNFMPFFLFDEDFVSSTTKILSKNGFIIFNTMVTKKSEEVRNLEYISFFNDTLFEISKISKLEKFNELIIIKKL